MAEQNHRVDVLNSSTAVVDRGRVGLFEITSVQIQGIIINFFAWLHSIRCLKQSGCVYSVECQQQQ